ncbi:reverse transcriptase domain-containing protein [Tanacetum coccineum]
MTRAAIKKLVADSVSAALEAQAATMANTDNTNRSTGKRETLVARKYSYKEFMSCQPFNFKGRKAMLVSSAGLNELNRYFSVEAYKIPWSELKKLLLKKYCPLTEIKKMEDEFYNLNVKGNDLKTYVRRFQELAVLCPTMVLNSEKLMEVFIGGLPQSIEGNVTVSKPQTLEEAITITQRIMDQVTKHNSVQGTNDHKRMFDDRRTFTNNNYQNNHNNKNNNRYNDHHQQHNRRQETARNFLPPQLKIIGILETFLYVKDVPCITQDLALSSVRLATRWVIRPGTCSKANNSAHGRAYMLRDKNAHQDPNVVTSTFLLNQHLARVLFDSGSDKSLVSISLASMLNIPPITLDTTYDIEMANGNLVGTNTVSQGCTLILLNQPFRN